jgi:hypothetical protein
MATRPRRVLHRGQVASYCPVILHPAVPDPSLHWPSVIIGFFAGLVISFEICLQFGPSLGLVSGYGC